MPDPQISQVKSDREAREALRNGWIDSPTAQGVRYSDWLEGDILRLRAENVALDDAATAAQDEVERLQGLFEARGRDVGRLDDERRALRVENEELLAAQGRLIRWLDESKADAGRAWTENERLRRALDCVERWAQEQHDYCWPPHLKDEPAERVNELRGPCATYGAVVYELVVNCVKRHRKVALASDEQEASDAV